MKIKKSNRRSFVKNFALVAAASPLFANTKISYFKPLNYEQPKESSISKQDYSHKSFLELGKPNPGIDFTAGPYSVFGRYTSDSRITFEGKCVNPWEFMATGTGVSGLTVAAGREVTGQINHSAAFDEKGMIRSLGIFRLDWYDTRTYYGTDRRFSGIEKQVQMVHDLRRSVITITSKGGNANIRLEVRAHKDLDVIRIDVFEESSVPDSKGQLHFHLQKDYLYEDRIEDNTYLSWHVNRTGEAANRCFGTAMTFDVPEGYSQKWMPWGRGKIENSGQRTPAKYTLWIVAGSNGKGFDAWNNDVRSRLEKAQVMGEEFITSHEVWWQKFWERSSLELPDKNESHLRHQAAFDLYRYYVACSAGRQRETPLCFMNDLFRFNEEPVWLGGDYMAIETYQSWYGTTKTGDLDALGSRMESYVRLLPAMKRWVHNNYGHDGAIIPYSQNIVQPYLGNGDITTKLDSSEERPLQLQANGNLFMLMLFCDYATLGGDEQLIEEGLLQYASGVLTFFREHYPKKSANGRIDFTPSIAGETYYNATDSAELIVAMKSLLPRLFFIGESRGWDKATLNLWRQMYRELPDLPRGSIVRHTELKESVDKSDLSSYALWYKTRAETRISLEKSELLAPVRHFDRPFSHAWNYQHTELFSIWPGKLMLRDVRDRDVAIRSYNSRLFQHAPCGWSLDNVFAACLGLRDEVKRWWSYQFDTTFTFPCGLAQEEGPRLPDKVSCSSSPSMHGLGTGVIPVLEMLLTDYPDRLVILPCWEPDVAVRYSLYSPYAGKVKVDYDPRRGALVETERSIRLEFGKDIIPMKT